MRFETPKTGSPCSELRPKCVSNHLSSSTEKSRRIISENLRRDCHPNYHVYGNSYRSTPFRLSESLRFPTVRLRFNTRLQFDGHDAQHRPRGLAQSVFSSPPRLATSRPDLDMVRRVAEAKNALHYATSRNPRNGAAILAVPRLNLLCSRRDRRSAAHPA